MFDWDRFCSIKRDYPAIVSVTVENVSGGELDLKATYTFELLIVSSQAMAEIFDSW
jgi:hypothetical protein